MVAVECCVCISSVCVNTICLMEHCTSFYIIISANLHKCTSSMLFSIVVNLHNTCKGRGKASIGVEAFHRSLDSVQG